MSIPETDAVLLYTWEILLLEALTLRLSGSHISQIDLTIVWTLIKEAIDIPICSSMNRQYHPSRCMPLYLLHSSVGVRLRSTEVRIQ